MRLWTASENLICLVIITVKHLEVRTASSICDLRDSLQWARPHNWLWLIDYTLLLYGTLEVVVIWRFELLNRLFDIILWYLRYRYLFGGISPRHQYLIRVYIDNLLWSILYVYYLGLCFFAHDLLEARADCWHMFSSPVLWRPL